MANPYEILGVAPSATQDDIRKAYRKAAKETHPDLNPGKPEAESRFKEINAAYDIIGDADKRKRYDAGEIDETGAERQPERHFYREYAEADPNMRYSRRGTAGAQSGGEADLDFDVFADLFRGRGEHGGFRMPPRDVRYALEIDFLDAVNGARKVVSMPDGKTLDIAIPAGVDDGQVLRLKGQGLPGSDGQSGDAYVQISVRPHPGFRREGADIVSELPVSLGEALNGASVRIETVDGQVDVKVPKGAKEGTKLRLRGKGALRGKSGERGDQLVEIHIVPPEGADEALAQFMAEWEKSHPQQPRRKGAT
ncbi:J domain-containing protein [Hyphomicrobium sp. CS1BSMeth3]|uniref:DnaJ C-terminal domain-containing protein n=1 Tax=Hyphomicrobium sp. CS1BSMeth3 TaxID=1892844 RepID=UPI00092FE939|nr:J domain-containing protein [Hyphomicrobium sp. CS1BSMeth3]